MPWNLRLLNVSVFPSLHTVCDKASITAHNSAFKFNRFCYTGYKGHPPERYQTELERKHLTHAMLTQAPTVTQQTVFISAQKTTEQNESTRNILLTPINISNIYLK